MKKKYPIRFLKYRNDPKLIKIMLSKRTYKGDVLDTYKAETDIIQLMFKIHPTEKVTWLDSIYAGCEYSKKLSNKGFLTEQNIKSLGVKNLIGFIPDPNAKEGYVKGRVAKEHIEFWTALSGAVETLQAEGIVEKITDKTVKINLFNTASGRTPSENKLQVVATSLKNILSGFKPRDQVELLKIILQ